MGALLKYKIELLLLPIRINGGLYDTATLSVDVLNCRKVYHPS